MITDLIEAEKLRQKAKDQNKTVGFTSGCFDILTRAHLHSLVEAKSYCDLLIVAVNTNESVRQLKGTPRPINDATDRAGLVDGLKPVDYVIYNSGLNNNTIISILKPDFYIKSGEYKGASTSAEIVESYGGKNVFIPILEGYSTSRIIQKIKETC